MPRNADKLAAETEKEVWGEVDCLSCANCCKQMSPTYTPADIKRIAAYKGMTAAEFKMKWLYKDRTGDWLNKSTPCQFLDLSTNMCSVYEVRPVDCAGFPPSLKKKIPGLYSRASTECGILPGYF
ncbi:MAG: YkgJ family cysteine cluster protein [Bacteroidota bacterium]